MADYPVTNIVDEGLSEENIWQHKHQAARRKALCKIIVSGIDVTSRIDPHLISIEVIDKRGAVDTCSIELDDRDGRLQIPADSAPIEVSLGWANPEFYSVVFFGEVTSVESGFGRKSGGRRLWIDATGIAGRSDGHTPIQMSIGEGAPPGEKEGKKIKFSEAIQKLAGAANHSITVSPALGNLERDFWNIYNESFYHWSDKMGKELGGVFKVNGTRATFSELTSFSNAAGQAMGTVIAEWGNNLIEWRIKPYVFRPAWGQAQSEAYDTPTAKWEQFKKSIDKSSFFQGSKGTIQLPAPAPNKSVGEQTNNGAGEASVSARGTGWALINGEPEAHAGSLLKVIGAREGVDGDYCIDEAHHKYSRSGYTTLCKLTWPQAAGPGEAGT